MTTASLSALAAAKEKLAEEIRKLEEQEAQLRQQQSSEAYTEIVKLLDQYTDHFSAKQKSEIAALIGADVAKPKKAASKRKEVAPKYWLPHNQETWSGRGRPPKAFTIWQGSASYKEWKAKHPDEKFPAFPG
ncbi:H-NS family nucleoid-associated regulatory protein [Xanthomonas citri pv. glycines]|uniref:Histone-like nucleoid-structuring protein n=1 Tax=Xanthomonas campestris pv. glycines TaxID=473421 RepID=A0AAX0I517_XANCG|nr:MULTISPECIES: H-NS family nucleoid-associated regulatory protein [Xanthomonas]AOY63312.1 histone-like nucleoid-structuring protein [Xanthomonas citri pv. glycines str. 8ra]ARV22870.1 histone-like nucleoid-structuring protein [Xanthomonas citri pv. glycines str. 12-2]OEY98738.1 histone-like nucleoid-structuring protein [Xanthomonas citri pv. glycines]OOX02529.1 histone-like nucleoid-structuring protein [Xanthomonas citri pv. glycines]QDR45040.1 histone-like nucleoid-structuring protein [Xant